MNVINKNRWRYFGDWIVVVKGEILCGETLRGEFHAIFSGFLTTSTEEIQYPIGELPKKLK